MFVSVFDVFKISVGPSSSHTMGPMIAARRFCDTVSPGEAERAARLTATLYGSLAHTGKGHGTHGAILAGLLGFLPETYDRDAFERAAEVLRRQKTLGIGSGTLDFDPETDLVTDKLTRLAAHPNGMAFALVDAAGETIRAETYFSVGGGFVATPAELAAGEGPASPRGDVPYPFATAEAMLAMGAASGLSIAAMKRANEVFSRGETDLDARLAALWGVMEASIERGLATGGELPGGLRVKRRAAAIAQRLGAEAGRNDAPLHTAIDWLTAYAMAVNEENAAGGQVVTAPTNGAAGVFPAVMRYALAHVPGVGPDRIADMLLTGAAIGGLIKFNASISGAEVGCQGEVGSASAMAAAALCCALGGTNAQIENAAEIALEHHLGMTCDPVRGLVQVPCIERNGLGAVKAVTAASLALQGDGNHIVSLDACIATMHQTGKDMDQRYKETALGGLSVAVPEC